VDVEGTRASFYNLNLASYQDTFLSHNSGQLIYLQECLVQGDTDFIWGYGTVYFTNCEIRALSSGAHVTQPRSPSGANGLAFVDCRVTKGFSSGTFDLGRTIGSPTSPSQVLFMRCLMDDAVTGYSSDAGTNMADYACSNLTATVAKTLLYSTHATSSDPFVVAARSAPTWLYGWQPSVAPGIVTQPTNQTVNIGTNMSFEVSATGVPAPAFQWLKNGTNLTGQTSATLSLTNSNSAGLVTSSNATLTVLSAVNTSPTSIVYGFSGSNLILSWPADHSGWRLEAQTNSLAHGLGTNWVTVGGSAGTNRISIPISTTGDSVFYRLAYP
jgi:hypothetical protein